MVNKILVVDGDPAFARLIEQVLTRHGYQVIKVSGGREGLRLLFHQKPDLVLLEVAMNGMDGWLTFNVAERMVFINGERVRLTPKEFSLFAILVQNADRVVTHKMLLEKVWGWEYVDDLDHVRIYIWHLRQKIEPDPAQPRYIIAEPGVGYYFRKSRI